MGNLAPKLVRACGGAAIGFVAALAACAPVLMWLDAQLSDGYSWDTTLVIVIAGPLVIINSVVAAVAAAERFRVLLSGAVGTGLLFAALACTVNLEDDALSVVAVPGAAIPAAVLAWSGALGIERMMSSPGASAHRCRTLRRLRLRLRGAGAMSGVRPGGLIAHALCIVREQALEIPTPVQNPQNLNSIRDQTKEDQVVWKTTNRPEAGLPHARGRGAPLGRHARSRFKRSERGLCRLQEP